MGRWIDSNSPLPAIFRCYRANKILLLLVPACLGVMIASGYFNNRAQYHFSYIGVDGAPSVFKSLRAALAVLFMHYFLAHLSSLISQICSVLVLRAFLSESVNKYAHMEYTEFHSKGSGNIQDNISRSSRAAREVAATLSFEIPKAGIDFLFAFISLQMMIAPRPFFAFVLLFNVSLVFSVVVAIYSYRSDKLNLQTYRRSLTPLSDILNNFDLIRAYNKEKREVKQYDQALSPFVTRVQAYRTKLMFLLFFQKVIMFLPHLFIFWSVSREEQIWKETPRSAEAFVGKLLLYNKSFDSMKKAFLSLRDNIFMLLREMAEMRGDLKFARGDVTDRGLIQKNAFNVGIKLDQVDLYAGNNLIQKGQSFMINKGDKVAITGTNGAGKSVFIKTLLKFFKNEGKLCIDDVLIERISTKALRNLIAYVPQDPHIFNRSVMYNLGYSQKTIDERKIFEECQRFGLHEFFKQMRDGYETESGERGKYLSGGQKQRIAFMRAIIKDAPIIVMDEPTANIDRSSECELIEKILTLCSDKTFILIAHNQELLRRFDKILYFTKDGVRVFDSYESFTGRG